MCCEAESEPAPASHHQEREERKKKPRSDVRSRAAAPRAFGDPGAGSARVSAATVKAAPPATWVKMVGRLSTTCVAVRLRAQSWQGPHCDRAVIFAHSISQNVRTNVKRHLQLRNAPSTSVRKDCLSRRTTVDDEKMTKR